MSQAYRNATEGLANALYRASFFFSFFSVCIAPSLYVLEAEQKVIALP